MSEEEMKELENLAEIKVELDDLIDRIDDMIEECDLMLNS